MKTNNYGLELMVPLQNHKEIVFNEAIINIDSFCNVTVNNFIEEKPAEISINEKYIILYGEFKNYICYLPSNFKNMQLLKPQNGMIFLVRDKKKFYIFEEDDWIEVNFCNCT